jgi:ribosomal protein S18 acetylase RimI-like enzyme
MVETRAPGAGGRSSASTEALPARLWRCSLNGWQFVWQIAGGEEYALCGYWRHRRDIGHIVSITSGPYQAELLGQAVADYRRQGVALVLASPIQPQSSDQPLWRQGFRGIEEVVRYERILVQPPDVAPRGLHFRRYAAEDSAGVLAVDHETFPWLWRSGARELEWYAGLSGVQVWVAQKGPAGPVIGLLGVTLRPTDGHIDRLAIRPEHQGHGYGESLLSFGLSLLWERDIRRVSLSTQHNNHRAQNLYRKLGFAVTAWRQCLYGLWLDQAARAAAEHDCAL